MLSCCQPATAPRATHFVLVFWICFCVLAVFLQESVMGCPQKPEPTTEFLVFRYTKTEPPELWEIQLGWVVLKSLNLLLKFWFFATQKLSHLNCGKFNWGGGSRNLVFPNMQAESLVVLILPDRLLLFGWKSGVGSGTTRTCRWMESPGNSR